MFCCFNWLFLLFFFSFLSSFFTAQGSTTLEVAHWGCAAGSWPAGTSGLRSQSCSSSPTKPKRNLLSGSSGMQCCPHPLMCQNAAPKSARDPSRAASSNRIKMLVNSAKRQHCGLIILREVEKPHLIFLHLVFLLLLSAGTAKNWFGSSCGSVSPEKWAGPAPTHQCKPHWGMFICF